MARVPGLGPGGREFESRIPEVNILQKTTSVYICLSFYRWYNATLGEVIISGLCFENSDMPPISGAIAGFEIYLFFWKKDLKLEDRCVQVNTVH